MKIKTILLTIPICLVICISIVVFVLPESESEDNTSLSFRESHFVIAIRDNPHINGVKDVTCRIYDPECGCDNEYTLQMKFLSNIPIKNQQYIFEGTKRNNIYYVEKINRD